MVLPSGRILLDDSAAREWARTVAAGAQSAPAEDTARWSTNRSVLRAAARDVRGSASSDAAKVRRHLRRLSRSFAAVRHDGAIVQKVNKRGQTVSDVRVRVLRGWKVLDGATGEVTRTKRYVVGYYQGGGGFSSVNDGRVSAGDIARLLGGTPGWSREAFELRA